MPLGRHKLAFSTNKSVRKQSAAGDNWQASTSAKSPPRPRRICSVQCTDHSTAWLPARDISPSVVRTYNACKHRRQNIDKRFSFRRETALGNPSFGRNISGMTPLNSYGTSVQNLPPLHFPAGHFELANSGKLLGINLDADFSWKSHVEAITSKATQRLFSKTTQACGCPPRPVASVLHRGNQACIWICGPSLESLAHENANWPTRSNTKASS